MTTHDSVQSLREADPATTSAQPGRKLTAARGSRHSLRAVLASILFVPLLLLAVVCAGVVWYQTRAQTQKVYESLRTEANAISLAIDREIDRSKAIVETLAASELIDRQDWRALDRLARAAIAGYPNTFIALTDPSGAQPVRTVVPYGTALTATPRALGRSNAEIEWNGHRLPLSTQGLAQRVFETGRMSNTGLYYGMSIRKPAVSVAVPVVREGRTRYVFIIGFSTERLVALLQQAGTEKNRVGIIDAAGRIVAQSFAPETAIGVSIRDDLLDTLRSRVEGVGDGVSLSGEETVGAFRRLRLVDWTVYHSTPKSQALAHTMQAMLLWSLIGAGMLALAFYIAGRLWLKLAPPLIRLGKSADAIQRGDVVDIPDCNIAEIDDLASLLREAANAQRREHAETTRRAIAEEGERATKALVKALSVSERRFRMLFENSGAGIASVDLASYRFVLVNRRFCEITGYGEAELLALTFADITHPDDRANDAKAVEALKAGRCEAYDTEKRYVRKDGSLCWVQLHVRHFPERQPGDARMLSFVSIIDITQRKQAELALKAADRRKDEFLATLAHELRNPLAPLSSGVEILKRKGDDPATVSAVQSLMDRQVKHMVRLIDDLLDVSRITTGRLQLQQSIVDVAEVMRAAAESSRPMLEARSHRLSVAIEGGPLAVQGDFVRLTQVLDNLLTNAAKYTEHPGEIVLAAARRGGQVILSVIDRGIGIPADKLDVIFDIFTQVHGNRGRSRDHGLGIGLHLVKRLVELHGGTVTARSAGVGKGAEFVITLPAAARLPQPTAHSVQPPAPAPALDILVVDDNIDAAESMAALLGVMGHEVRTAFTGEDALRSLAHRNADVVLLDIGMPEMDGYEVARRIGGMSLSARPFIAAVSGWGQHDDKRRTAAAGFDAHLVKPVGAGELEEMLLARSPR